MKAVYPSLSYALFTVISIISLSIVIIWVSSFSEGIQSNYANEQLNYAADIVRSAVLDMYATNASCILQVPMPRYIVGRQYSVELSGTNISLTLNRGSKTIQVNRSLDVNASMSGKSFAPVTISLDKEGMSVRLV
jgi:hypothetical protein